jgi:hypothetical protein
VPPSEFVDAAGDLGETLVVLERDRAAANIEDEGAETAVVDFPAGMALFEIVPRQTFDRLGETGLGEGMVRVGLSQL